MIKAVISNRIYISELDDITKNIIKKELTYKIKRNIGSKQHFKIETIRNWKSHGTSIFSIPQTRLDLLPKDTHIIDNRVKEVIDYMPRPLLQLREDQLDIYNKVDSSCLIHAKPGWGKTFTALQIVNKLGGRALVATPTVFIRDQWKAEIRCMYNIDCGIIGGGIFDVEFHPIIVGNIQSLVKYKDYIRKNFTTLIIDECHHTPASTFSNIVNDNYAYYKIGLTGTPIREDGKHIMFEDYFGSKVYTAPEYNTIQPTIYLVNSNIYLNPSLTWASRVTELCNSSEYQKMIATIAEKQVNEGQCVLIVAERVEFLHKVKEILGDECIVLTGSFGDRSEAIKNLMNGSKKVVAASRQIFTEGLSINILSCLILATPFNSESSLEQVIGRVQRKFPGKEECCVIDIQFDSPTGRRQNIKRKGLYLKRGWEVKNYID